MARNEYTQSGKALQTQQANTPNAIIQRHKAFLDARMRQIQSWVREGVRPEALVRFTLMDMANNEKLRACTPDSIYLGLLACAVTGLEPGALKGEAYLVPFNNRDKGMQATFIPGWKGLVKQARRSREIKGLVANVVRERDTFDIDLGTAKAIIHKPKLGREDDRGDVIGAYGIATLASGEHEIEWMDRADLDSIQKVAESRGKSPAWSGWQDQMQRKSVIRRLAKRLPLGSDYYVAMALEQAHDDGREQSEVLDIETDGAATKAQDQADAAPDMAEPAFNPEEVQS
jgi:recombination protein RecT